MREASQKLSVALYLVISEQTLTFFSHSSLSSKKKKNKKGGEIFIAFLMSVSMS